ncbi:MULTISPECIES: questin oxidase family protein [unclassified Rhizobium]|uniref:questin oxidase family protein n=1 Tax=Rhizobium sp. PP-CC-3G-465 TaxID=2135648 RepID=UPI000D866413|nr:uncharacterized protein DUF4243 [Rhizobium sp. PP-WC-1G-195]TCQ25895.1 uncharacterized protein DUF4243 [Rhizobium sp. PP-CC-3G-465]
MTLQETAGNEIAALMAEMPHWGSEFDRTFANHAPMVLVALARIGGKPHQLRRFFSYYRDTKKLLPFAQARSHLTVGTWTSRLGERQREPELRLFFLGEVSRLGIDGALRRYLPRLAPGIAASAFHALMRTAYGVLEQDPDAVAIALGYWAATYLPLPAATGERPRTDDPAEVLALTAEIAPLHGLPLHDLLWQNMRDAAAVPAFRPVVDWLEIGPDTMRRMAATALALFAGTQHFAALHALTGLHWIRLVSPHCDAATTDTMLRVFWQGIAALMGELGFPVLPEASALDRWRHLPAPGWADIHAAAAESYDEHDISLAFSAFEEMAAYGDPLYRVVAARRLGMIGDYR